MPALLTYPPCILPGTDTSWLPFESVYTIHIVMLLYTYQVDTLLQEHIMKTTAARFSQRQNE